MKERKKKNLLTTTMQYTLAKENHITVVERSTPSMPAAYDLNHSKYTVQKITDEWKNRITTLVRNNGNKKAKKKQKPSATNT